MLPLVRQGQSRAVLRPRARALLNGPTASPRRCWRTMPATSRATGGEVAQLSGRNIRQAKPGRSVRRRCCGPGFCHPVQQPERGHPLDELTIPRKRGSVNAVGHAFTRLHNHVNVAGCCKMGESAERALGRHWQPQAFRAMTFTCAAAWLLAALLLPLIVIWNLTESRSFKIRRWRKQGRTWRQIATTLGVSQSTARRWAKA